LGNICPVGAAMVEADRWTDGGRQQALFATYKNEDEKWQEKRRYISITT